MQQKPKIPFIVIVFMIGASLFQLFALQIVWGPVIHILNVAIYIMIAMICSDIVNGQLKKIPELRMTRFKYDITSAAVSFGILLYLGAKAAYWAWGTPIGWFALLFTIGLIAVMIFLGKKAIAGPDIWWKGEKKAKFPETEEAQEEDDQCESKG